ncbi:hypothetical protein GCM10027037_33350 [Mucilaginibacter koreensis]
MIYPRKNKFIHSFFHHYVGHILRRNFKALHFGSIEVKPDKSILLLANHFGWWDGFILYWLNHLRFKKRFHIMILEDTVQKVFFLKYMGAFSMIKNSREMLISLQYAAELLQDPNNLVLIFPQGKLYSNFVNEVHTEKGLMKVVQPASGRFQYVLAATFVENFQHKKPSVYTYLSSSEIAVTDINQLQQLYQQHYSSAKLQHTQNVV